MKNTNLRRFTCGMLVLCAGQALAQTTATYTGPTNGAWNTPGNWNIGVVPLNNGPALFNAIIPQSTTVNFDIAGASQLTGLNLQLNGLLKFSGGQQLEVTGVSVIAGKIEAKDPATLFRATSAFASLQPNGRASVTAGAIVRLGGISYQCTASYGDILTADGSGSLLDMSSFGSISFPWNGGCCNYAEARIRASNGAVVDLSNVNTLVGASVNGNLRIRQESGGIVDLSRAVSTTGLVIFEPATPLFTLPMMQSATNATFNVLSGSSISLPSISSVSSSTFNVAAGAGTISAPVLASCTSSVISLADGAVFFAPALKTFDYTSVSLNPNRTFTVPAFTSVNGAQILVSGGKSFAIAATGYSTSGGPGDVFVADGSGSSLDLSSLLSFSSPWDGGCCTYKENRIRASAGGFIDLSKLQTLVGATNNGLTRIRAENAGSISLNALKTSTGLVSFEASGSSLSMPSLTSATSATFNVNVFDTISVPALQELRSATLNISDGGMIVAPSLTTFESSYVELTPSRFLTAPPFAKIDNSQIFVRDGATLDVAATSYLQSGRPGDVFVADGVGAILDLSSVTTFKAPWNGGCCAYGETRVRASNGGVIELLGLAKVDGAVANGLTKWDAASGGSLRFGNVDFVSGISRISADGIFSSLYFGSVSLRASSQLVMTLVSNIHVSGDFSFTATDENSIQLGNGKMILDGARPPLNPQRLEVGGADLGLPVGTIAQNFQIGQLTVGRVGLSTNALLVDAIDNGNRGTPPKPEQLHLQGFPADDGLRILGGSTLYLGSVELYAVLNNQWKRVRDLFPEGERCISYDGGRICLGDAIPCPSDLNWDGLVDDADFPIFVSAYNTLDCADPTMPAGCPSDLNTDGVVDDADFSIFVVAYDALLCP